MTGFTEGVDADAKLRSKNASKRKEGMKMFPTLNKIDEVDETLVKSSENDKDENGNVRLAEDATTGKQVMWKSRDEVIHIDDVKCRRPRPKSASCVGTGDSKTLLNGSRPSRIPVKSALKKCPKRRPSSAGARPLDTRDFFQWEDELDSLLGFDDTPYSARPTSACGVRTPNCGSSECLCNWKGECISCSMVQMDRCRPRRCHSNPNISSRKSSPARDIIRFKRSLKLLGLEPRDFGICDLSPESRRSSHSLCLKHIEPTFSTKILERSMSLDCLREAVRGATMDNYLGVSHRKLLAQAAYEEWYFRKSEEALKKLKVEKVESLRNKEKLETEFIQRKTKAEEHFKKWMEVKNFEKKRQNGGKVACKTQLRVTKTKEEAEKAYKEWKKEKNKELEKKQRFKVDEEERKLQEEKQKEEKKIQAEKAFQEWKRRLEQAQKKAAQAKLEKEKTEKQEQESFKSLGKATSFQIWKTLKDQEIKQKLHKARTAAKLRVATRSLQVAERLYEAEQAFEEWLDKVELRKHKQLGHVTRIKEKSKLIVSPDT